MQYVTREDDISILPLSVRLSNCLRRANIHTVGAMIDYPNGHEWADIRNMGAKSIDEVSQLINGMLQGSGDYCLVDQATKAEMVASISVSNTEEEDTSIEHLGLSVRAHNCLKHAGIHHISQLLGKSVSDLLLIKNMGRNTAQEVFSIVENWLSLRTNRAKDSSDNTSKEEKQSILLSTEISNAYNVSQSSCLHEIMLVNNEHPETQGETFYYRLYEAQFVRDAIKARILTLLERNKDGMTPKALAEQMPHHLENTTILEEILLELEFDNQVLLGEALIVRLYPSIITYISELEDERAKEILFSRLDGKSLEDIGEKYNISRSRVQQITSKYQRRIHKMGRRFREDKYSDIYNKYLFQFEDFFLVFDEPVSTYYYLETFCSTSNTEKKPLEAILEDQTVSVAIRKQAERAIYKNYVTLNGVRVKKQRSDLVYHVVKTKCNDLTEFDTFVSMYQDIISSLDLQDESEFIIEGRYYENRLNTANYVLWNLGRSFRYYETNNRDFSQFLEALNLPQYENCEITTLKLFRDNPELMHEYDIRDEYELHNLLKKIRLPDDLDITFHRMPTIEIGHANRDNQVLDILLQYAPISIDNLAKIYEDTYGVKSATVISNYLKNFSEFFYNGVYSIEANNLPLEQYNRMLTILDHAYYSISDIRRLYLREFPQSDPSQINPYTLKTLGFRVYSNYVIKNQYPNASSFFHEMLTIDDVIDGREHEKGLGYIQAYSGELANLKREREIIEYSPRQYINIRRLNTCGITLSMLNEYCNAVYHFVDHHAFFTVASLRKDGFSHPLDDLGFDDWFYSSVLLEDRKHFSYNRMGGARLFKVGTENIAFSDMLRWIIESYQKIDIYDLCTLLDERYGIDIRKDKLIYIIQSTDMYYDVIMEAVYIDYDTYFEEV